MLYRRVEILDNGDSAEPVQFVGVHPFGWDDKIGPTAGFVEVDDDSAEALRAASDELARASGQLLEFTREQIATAGDLHEVFELDAALCRWREVTGAE